MTPDHRQAEYARFLEAYPNRMEIPRVIGFSFPQCDGWMRRSDIASKELAAKDAIIADLVRLLERGNALYVAGRGSGSYRQQGCHDDARVEEATARLILAEYDAAIEQYGSVE